MPWWFWLLPLPLLLHAAYRIATTGLSEERIATERLADVTSRLLDAQPGTTLVLLRQAGSGFVQLRTAATGASDRSVELGLPEVEWSQPRFDALVSALREAGYVTKVDQGTRCAEVRQYLRVSIVGSSRVLREKTPALLARVVDELGWGGDDHLIARFERP